MNSSCMLGCTFTFLHTGHVINGNGIMFKLLLLLLSSSLLEKSIFLPSSHSTTPHTHCSSECSSRLRLAHRVMVLLLMVSTCVCVWSAYEWPHYNVLSSFCTNLDFKFLHFKELKATCTRPRTADNQQGPCKAEFTLQDVSDPIPFFFLAWTKRATFSRNKNTQIWLLPTWD